MSEPEKPPTVWQTIQSVLASFFGVQSARNRQRDFTAGKPMHFIVVGVVMTVLFVLVVVLAVKLALSQAGM
jgi:hypothetical protein